MITEATYSSSSLAFLQYVRMHWDWVADSPDKMINLALMDTSGNSSLHHNVITSFSSSKTL